MNNLLRLVLVATALLLVAETDGQEPLAKPRCDDETVATEEETVGTRNASADDPPCQGPVARLPEITPIDLFSGFSPDERFLTANHKLWEVATGRLVAESDRVGAFVFSADGTPWQIEWKTKVVHVKRVGDKTAFTIEGKLPYLSASTRCVVAPPLLIVPRLRDKEAVDLWDITKRKRLLTFRNADLHNGGPLHRENWLVISQNGKTFARLTSDHDICLLDLDGTKAEPCVIPWRSRQTNAKYCGFDTLVLSWDGQLVAGVQQFEKDAGQRRATVRIWNTHTRDEQCVLRQDTTGLTASSLNTLHFSFSPGGNMFVTQPVPITAATRPKELKLSVWDTKNGSCLRQYPMRTIDDLRATARSSDSYVFADIGNCRFWPLGTCLSMSHAPKWSAQIRNSLVMSPDGFFFVAAPNYNVVYETASQRPVCHLPLGRRNRPIMFSPTGRYLVSSSADDETLIWDLQRFLGPSPTQQGLPELVADLRDPAGAAEPVGGSASPRKETSDCCE